MILALLLSAQRPTHPAHLVGACVQDTALKGSHAGGACCGQVGLGTDVAGGYSPSMLSAMRSAVLASKAVRMLHIDAARRQAGCSNPCTAQEPVRTLPAEEGSAAVGASLFWKLFHPC